MILSLAIHSARPVVTEAVPIFLMVLLIILLTPMLLGRFKIPHVIGFILAGVAVGPYGFNILARDMSFEVFGQVGILYLMFLAGIEIDMFNLKRNIRKGMVFGLYTFAVPLLIGMVVAFTCLHTTMLSSMLLASMLAAHTLIAYPIVSRFGLTKAPSVVIAIAGTIFTVLGSLIVLAGVTEVYRRHTFDIGATLMLLGRLILYCLALAYIYPRITRWFFRRYGDSILQFIYVLAMVFLGAELAVLIGLEGVFGAFYAGILLNRFVPARSPLMGRLEFVGNAIFIPYFLIGVGMLINIRVVTTDLTTIYVAAVMSAAAMGSKWLAAWLTQKTLRLRPIDRSVIYQLSNAHTAVALAVVMIGFNMGIFGESILNGTVIMILVTCTVSSVGTARAAARLKVLASQNQLEHDDESGSRRRHADNILIPIANPLMAPELVDLALMMRGERHRGGKVYALHVRNDNSPSSRAIGRNSLDAAETLGASVDTVITPLERYDLNFVTGVINTIEERDISEVVIGLHRRNQVVLDSFFGDKLTQLLRATNRMIVIVRSFIPLNTVQRLVVAVPDKAQFETGFSRWVSAIGNLGRQLGCQTVFCCFADTRRAVETVLRVGRYEIRRDYRIIDRFDDIIIYAGKVMPDDMFVMVSSRRAAVSFTPEMDEMTGFMQRYLAAQNMMIVFPEQFGRENSFATMAESLSTDLEIAPSPLWVKLRAMLRSADRLRRRFTGRENTPSRYDL